MSLDHKRTISDEVRAKIKRRGPGEGKKLQVKRRVMGKWKTHPVDRLVKIANFIEPTNPDLAAKIWLRLLDSCELEEKSKKSSLPPLPLESPTSETDASQLLKELENHGNTQETNSDTTGLEHREPSV